MGWLWGSAKDNASENDPFRDMDPSLKEFLIKESPVKYTPTPAPQKKAKQQPTNDAEEPRIILGL